MNAKERVLAALHHEEADRVPIGEWGVDHDTVEAVIGKRTFWRSRRQAIKAVWAGRRDEVITSLKEDLIQLVENLDYDLVPVHLVPPAHLPAEKITTIGPDTYADEHGQIWGYSAGSDALLLLSRPRREIESEDDLVRVFESDVVERCGFRIKGKSEGAYELELADQSRLELVHHVVQGLGREKFVFARSFEEGGGSTEPLHFSEFEAASLFFGGTTEDFYVDLALRPQLVKKAFDLYTFVNLAMADEFIKAGVDAVMPGGDFSSSTGPIISPLLIQDVFLPGMKLLVHHAHQKGVAVLTHNCGNNWKVLPFLVAAGYDGWQSIQAETADMDLKRLKGEYGGRLALWGGINLESLQEGTPEQNRAEVCYALRHAAPGGGLILGTSNSVAYGCSYDNYMAALDAWHRFGNYPLCVAPNKSVTL